MHRLIIASAIVGTTLTSPFAQQLTPEEMEMAYNVTRNQLGVLTYCQEKALLTECIRNTSKDYDSHSSSRRRFEWRRS